MVQEGVVHESMTNKATVKSNGTSTGINTSTNTPENASLVQTQFDLFIASLFHFSYFAHCTDHSHVFSKTTTQNCSYLYCKCIDVHEYLIFSSSCKGDGPKTSSYGPEVSSYEPATGLQGLEPV